MRNTCPVIESSQIIGHKWFVPILEEIALGKFNGFNNFQASLPLTPKMLSGQLKEMEKAELIIKKNSTRDARTTYILSEKGREIHKIVIQLKKFNIKWNNVSKDCSSSSCLECGKISKKSAVAA